MKTFSTDRLDPQRIARRRIMFFSSIFVLTSLATWFMADLLWRGGLDGIEIALLVLFVILFAHIATAFCMALICARMTAQTLSFGAGAAGSLAGEVADIRACCASCLVNSASAILA